MELNLFCKTLHIRFRRDPFAALSAIRFIATYQIASCMFIFNEIRSDLQTLHMALHRDPFRVMSEIGFIAMYKIRSSLFILNGIKNQICKALHMVLPRDPLLAPSFYDIPQ